MVADGVLAQPFDGVLFFFHELGGYQVLLVHAHQFPDRFGGRVQGFDLEADLPLAALLLQPCDEARHGRIGGFHPGTVQPQGLPLIQQRQQSS